MHRLVLLALVLLLPAGLRAQSLSPAEQARLHPAFAALAAPADAADRAAALSTLGKVGATVQGAAAGKAADARFRAIVHTDTPEALRRAGFSVQSTWEGFATVTVGPDELALLARRPDVRYVDPGRLLELENDLAVAATGAGVLHAGLLNDTPYKGKGVTVVVFDTGIDWRHEDFRDLASPTRSRIRYLWDTTLSRQGSEATPFDRDAQLSCCNYGVEYTQAHIDDEIDGTPVNFVRARDTNGHGTHVAGSAAGAGLATGHHGGMAPEADLMVVRLGTEGINTSFAIDALDYVRRTVAGPVVVNMSFGSSLGAHDGSDPLERAIDAFAEAGRIVVKSAGNNGGSAIHKQGTLTSSEDQAFLSIEVPQYKADDGAANDAFFVDLWYDEPVAVTATITSPSGVSIERTFGGGIGVSPVLSDGQIMLFNQLDAGNGKRNVFVQVADVGGGSAPATGTWTLRLSSPAGPITYHAWVSSSSHIGAEFVGGDDRYSLSTPATAQDGIVVGSYATRWLWPASNGGSYLYSNQFDGTADISGFSSRGPTRDGRLKPEIAAPGQGVVSALSGDAAPSATRIIPGGRHWLLQGTSMAAPITAGAVALLLQQNPTLTPEAVRELLAGSAAQDLFTGTTAGPIWGAGKLNVLGAMARLLGDNLEARLTQLVYDSGAPKVFSQINSTRSLGLVISPTESGRLTGAFLQTHYQSSAQATVTGTGVLRVALHRSSGGQPGALVGQVDVPLAQVSPSTRAYLPLSGAGLQVEGGQDYVLTFSVPTEGEEVRVLMAEADAATPPGRTLAGTNGAWTPSNYNLIARAEVAVLSGSSSTAADDPATLPAAVTLEGNYPNPFNPTTTISYRLGQSGPVRLHVYDVLGRRVATLVEGVLPAGAHAVQLDATAWASGTYFYTLEAAGRTLTRPMLLVK